MSWCFIDGVKGWQSAAGVLKGLVFGVSAEDSAWCKTRDSAVFLKGAVVPPKAPVSNSSNLFSCWCCLAPARFGCAKADLWACRTKRRGFKMPRIGRGRQLWISRASSFPENKGSLEMQQFDKDGAFSLQTCPTSTFSQRKKCFPNS